MAIALGDGTYRGRGNRDVVLGGKSVLLYSSSDSSVSCTIDCGATSQDPYNALDIDASGHECWVDGISFTHGWSPSGSSALISCNGGNPVLAGCAFHNSGGSLAAVSLASGASETLRRCEFADNATTALAIVDCASIDVDSCRFMRNSGSSGGALWMRRSSGNVIGCEFSYNTSYDGGAVYCAGEIGSTDWSPGFIGCTFQGNRAHVGGGVYAEYCQPTLSNSLLRGNYAEASGGGVATGEDCGLVVSGCDIWQNSAKDGGGIAVGAPGARDDRNVRCVSTAIHQNTARAVGGGAVLFGGAPVFDRCTFGENAATAGSGLDLEYSGAELDNCIVWNNTGGNSVVLVDGIQPTLSCSDLYYNQGGDWEWDTLGQRFMRHNMSADPLFCLDQVLGGRYGLQGSSPCAANNNPACGQVGMYGVGCFGAGVTDGGIAGSDIFGVRCFPNPSRGGVTIAASSDANRPRRVEVFDVAGRLVRSWSGGGDASGLSSVWWDERDDAGRDAAAGVYFVRARRESSVASGHIVIVR